MGARYVFLGPSLPAAQARALVPGLTLLPPIALGDLLQLPLVPGDVVGIIDGFFRQVASVRHKEILFLLDQGVHVLGASSMGALRAAELEPFGMEGVGEVFRQYRSGELDGDDEVALQHLTAEEEYRPVSEALVNLRHNLLLAERAGRLSPTTRQAMIDLAKALPFPQRVLSHLLKLARDAGLPGGELESLRDFLQHQRVDLKREDALALMARLASFEAPVPSAAAPRMHPTTYFHRLQHSRTGQQVDAELFITDKGVLSLFQVCAPASPALHERVALRTLVALHASEQGLRAPPDAQLLARFQERHALASPEDLRRWLEEHQLQAEALAGLLRQEDLAGQAVARRTGGAREDGALEPEALAPLVAEYLVHRGVLESADALPRELDSWTLPTERETLTPLQLISRFAVRSLRMHPSLGWVAPALHELKRLGVFGQGLALMRRVLHFNRLFRERHPEIILENLSARAMGDWLSQRWGLPPELELAGLDRGLVRRADAVQMARLLYLFDRQHPGALRLSLPGLD